MIKNYLKIAIRNLGRYRLSAVINLIGLTLGIAVCLLILLFIQQELSYDDFHRKADRIALIQQFETSSRSGSGMAQFAQQQVGQIEQTVRLLQERALIGNQEQSFYEDHFYFVDSNFFEVFDFEVLQGDARSALRAPNSLVISERIATKYFPNTNPIGQTLEFEGETPLTVTAIMANTPTNSQLELDVLCSMTSTEGLLGQHFSSFWDSRTVAYALLAPDADIAILSDQLAASAKESGDPNSNVWRLGLLPLRDLHLRYALAGPVKATNAIENVYIFGIVALFILALACFNYVSLVTARSSIRSKEVGVRKVLGARRGQLLAQFQSESILMVLFAVILGMTIVVWLLPIFSNFIEIDLRLGGLLAVENLGILLGGIFIIGSLTGLYPALVLSAFSPLSVLKKQFFGRMNDALFRKILVTVQFVVSIGMIIATVVVMQQLNFIRHKDLGYNREQVLAVEFDGETPIQDRRVLLQQVRQLSYIEEASFVSLLPGSGSFNNKLVEQYVPQGKDVGYDYIFTDEAFLETFDVALIAGRNFGENEELNQKSFLVNRAMAEYLEWGDDAVGKELGYYSYQYTADGGYAEIPVRGTVIGVVEDYHQLDLRRNIQPMVIKYGKGNLSQLAMRVAAGRSIDAVNQIQREWKALFPKKPLQYTFLDESFQLTYRQETKTAQLFGVFSGLAILISCLGLLGLITFAAQQRVKEIGIRKVLGASAGSIIGLLSRDFLVLVVIAVVVATPLARYAMQTWLERFAYRIDLAWWMFLLAGLVAFGIAFATIAVQAARAARANPVNALRSE